MLSCLICSAARVLTAAAISLCGVAVSASAAEPAVPRPDHIVLAVIENRDFSEIIGSPRAPFINELANRGATFTSSFAVTRPSQPNYFALFTGSTQGVQSNHTYLLDAPTLAGSLRQAGRSFIGYVEQGSPRKHNPWQSFRESQNLEQDFSRFPSDFTKLPTVSFISPNLGNDMHDGSIERGDEWLRRQLGAYAEWCAKTNDLLILTFDESPDKDNHIATVFFGRSVKPGRYSDRIDHYTVLRTIEAMYDLPLLANSARRTPIVDIWQKTAQSSQPNSGRGMLIGAGSGS